MPTFSLAPSEMHYIYNAEIGSYSFSTSGGAFIVYYGPAENSYQNSELVTSSNSPREIAINESGWTILIRNNGGDPVTASYSFSPPPPEPNLFNSRDRLTRLQLSGVDLPPGSDSDISASLTLIGGASDLRRTVNGDLVNLSREVFRKYSVSISGSDMHPAALAGLAPGDYVEVSLPDRTPISLRTPSTSAQLPRAGHDVIGVTASGKTITPTAQPASPLPLVTSLVRLRVVSLRLKPTVTFSEPVVSVRYRPVLACLVTDWSVDQDERMASASWSLSLEEV